MKNHRQGGKFGGNHTSLLDTAVVMVDIAEKYPEVNTISCGHIRMGTAVVGGQRRVKFAWFQGGFLMTIRQSRSVQEVRVYTKDTQKMMLALARAARDRQIAIAFQKKES